MFDAIDPPDADIKLPSGEILLDRDPFYLEKERQLLISYQTHTIVTKNSSGDATYAKIIAARELKIPVVIVQRPIAPEGDTSAALAWLQKRF